MGSKAPFFLTLGRILYGMLKSIDHRIASVYLTLWIRKKYDKQKGREKKLPLKFSPRFRDC